MEVVTAEVLRLFGGDAAALALYENFAEAVCRRFGAVRVKAQKTQIAFSDRHIFACVSQLRVRPKTLLPPAYIVVTLGLPEPLNSQRVAAKTQPYPGRWTHHFVIGSAEELDGEFMGWVEAAYRFAQEK